MLVDSDHCNLKELPKSIEQLTSLTEIFISYCELGELLNSVGQLTNLELIHYNFRNLSSSDFHLVCR